MVRTPIAEVDQRFDSVCKAGLRDPDTRGYCVGKCPLAATFNDLRQRFKRPSLDCRPYGELAEVRATSFSALVAKDVTIPAPLNVAQAGVSETLGSRFGQLG